MNLRQRLKILEVHGGEFHEYVNRVVFGWINYSEAMVVVDNKFKEIYRNWSEHQDSSSKIGANFLLQTMAVMNTRFYRKLDDDLERLAEELDIPDYSPEHLQELVENNGLVPNKFKRLKTRVRKGLKDAQFLTKNDERYSTLADYLEKLYAVLSKE